MAEANRISSDRSALDLAGFAQEFLRRNTRYRSDYRTIMRPHADAAIGPEQEDMARSWGLSFPVLAR